MMANKTISMSNVRQIIKLYCQTIGKRKIAERLGMSKHTVKLYIDQFHSLQTTKDEFASQSMTAGAIAANFDTLF